METKRLLQMLCRLQILKLLVLIISLVAVVIIISQLKLLTFPYKSYTLMLPSLTKGILVTEAGIYGNDGNGSGPVLETLLVNVSKGEEGCEKCYILVSPPVTKGILVNEADVYSNDSNESGPVLETLLVNGSKEEEGCEKCYILVSPPVTKGILVNETDAYSNHSNESGGILKTLLVNVSKGEEGCKGYDCSDESLMSQIVMKQNDSGQTGQPGQAATKPSYKSCTLISPPVSMGILVNEADIYNNGSNESGPVLKTLSVNVSKGEGCKEYDCSKGSMISQTSMKQNDSDQTGQLGQTATRFSYMVSVLESTVAARFGKNKLLSARDRELKRARMKIENGPTFGNIDGLDGSLYHNISRFLRSYKWMENTLKVYIYKEGKKPVFHDPKLRGIYASEGWFMKLMENNRNFVVKDPKKAHLFYLPFSSLKLRITSQEQTFKSRKDLEEHLKNYTSLIAAKYPFWNRTNGTDHFLVACHDWAMKLTKDHMGNCIRSLCNSNLATGFKIGKDTTLPATYIRSADSPVQDLGGNPPSKRPIFAFFAGGMHGNLRPILLQYWQDKEPDIKILGPMARDIESKAKYRMYMKSSKYCICARGYEVYSPRIVESIYYECVPVIISDNYVPPFFEVLNWEAFSVFVLEKDVLNLGRILGAIPDEKYLEMQKRVKMVQKHFVWNKKPVKFDLFHMILHSVWNNRVFM